MKKKSSKDSSPTPEFDSERETRVILEEMNKNIKAIAEGHSSIIDKLENHDKRFDMLETAVTEVGARVKRIETKLDTVTEDHEQRIHKLEVVR